MDARTVLALWADDLDLDLTYGNAAELFDLFKKHGYQIIHRDENHGPTLERAAKEAKSWEETARKLARDETDKDRTLYHNIAGDMARDIYSVIRAMGEKK